MTINICDRCGDVTVADDVCRCATPCYPVEVRRRHQDAVDRARISDVALSGRETTRAA